MQRLDYLGISFRCLICKEVGHLKLFCPNTFKKQSPFFLDSDVGLEFESHWSANNTIVTCEEGASSSLDLASDSLIGKIKSFSPTLFSSLSMFDLALLRGNCLENLRPFSTPSLPEMSISPELILDDNKDLLETVSEGVLKDLF